VSAEPIGPPPPDDAQAERLRLVSVTPAGLGGDGFGPSSLGIRTDGVRVPLVAKAFYLDAPRGTVEAISEWRARSPGRGRRELMVKLIEIDGRWYETALQEPPPPPPPPRPRLVIRRDGVRAWMDSIRGWLSVHS
jgi:hypothetical protein